MKCEVGLSCRCGCCLRLGDVCCGIAVVDAIEAEFWFRWVMGNRIGRLKG